MNGRAMVPGLRADGGQALDQLSLATWLAANVDGCHGSLEIRQFAGGQSNPTYLVETPARRLVLRQKPLGKLLPSAHAVDREYRVLTALSATDVPVARPHALCEDSTVLGSPFYVMDYVDGRIFWDATLPELQPAQRAAIYEEMVRVQAALHSLDYAAIGLSNFGKPEGYITRQVSRWVRQYRASQTEDNPAFERLSHWLSEHVPAGDPASIVHGDFRLDNVIFHSHEPQILAVIDWELSTIGHPLVDFAYFCMRYRLPARQFRGLGGLAAEDFCIPLESATIATYRRLRRLDAINPSDWTYYIAFCMFRLAAILQGVLSRALQGNASSATALEAGQRAAPLAALAWQLVERSFEG